MENGERYLLCGSVFTYKEPELLDFVRLNAKTKNIIRIGDEVTVRISGRQTPGIIEEIHKAAVDSIIMVRISSTRYTLINTIHMEYRNYGKKGFYELV